MSPSARTILYLGSSAALPPNTEHAPTNKPTTTTATPLANVLFIAISSPFAHASHEYAAHRTFQQGMRQADLPEVDAGLDELLQLELLERVTNDGTKGD